MWSRSCRRAQGGLVLSPCIGTAAARAGASKPSVHPAISNVVGRGWLGADH